MAPISKRYPNLTAAEARAIVARACDPPMFPAKAHENVAVASLKVLYVVRGDASAKLAGGVYTEWYV